MEIKFKKTFNVKIFLLLVLFIFTNVNTANEDIDVQTSYDLEMPPFGKFKITGIVDIPNGEFTLKGGPQKQEFNLGLLTIENPFIRVTNKKGFGAQADATIFNKKATLGILEFKPGKRIIYNITPANKIEIPITPWSKTDINEFTLLITPEVFELGATVQIFGKPNLIKFGKTRPAQENDEEEPSLEVEEGEEEEEIPDNYAELILENIKPSDIIKSMTGNQFNNITFEHARFRIDNPFSKTAEHPITIEATTNLEKLGLPLDVNLSEVEAIIGIDKTTGLTLETSIPNVKIINNSELKDISLKIILPPKIKPQATQPGTETQPTQPDTETPPSGTAITNEQSIQQQSQQTQVNKPSIFLSGKTNLNLPLVGNIQGDFSAIYENGIFNFETQIDRSVEFEEIMKLNNVTVAYSTLGNIEIIGDTTIFDLNLIGKLKLSKTLPKKPSSPTSPNSEESTTEQTQSETTQQTTQTPAQAITRSSQTNAQVTSEEQTQQVNQTTPKYLKVGGYYVEFSATAKTNKAIKPFANITGVKNIKQIADISVSNPGLGMKPDKTFYITGQSDILGFKSDVKIELKNKNEITLKSRPPEDWRLSDAIKSLQGTVFDDMDLSDIQIVISSFQHFDDELQMTINRGVNLVAGAQLTGGKFNSAKALVSALDQKLRVAASIGSSPSEVYFSMAIPVKEIKLSEKAILKNVTFFMSGDGPSIGLKTQIMISPDKQDKALVFTGSVSIDPAQAGGTLSATMQGKWEHPLGVSGITLSDVAVEGTLPALTNMGLTGELLIGTNKRIKIAAAYSIDGQIVLMGEYEGKILLEDLISMAIKSNKNLNIEQFKDKFPDIGFENTMFKFAPRSTSIGEIHFDPGISLKGTLLVLKKKGLIDLNLGPEGIFARGTLDKFNIGPIEINGAGLDEIYGNEDDGPVVDFALCPEAQHFILSGLIDLKIAKGQADIHIGTDQIRIFLLAQLLKKFETNIEAYSVGSIKRPNELDFIFKAVATNEMNDYLIQQITKGLTVFSKETKEKIEARQDKIKEKESKIEEIQQKIKEKQEEIEKLKKEYNDIQESVIEYKN